MDYRRTARHPWTLNLKVAMIDIQNKHIVVIGAARSGLPAALLLKRHGASVFVTDHNAIKPRFKSKLKKKEIPFEENGHTDRAKQADFAVLSPGVPTDAPLVQHYLETDRQVFSEIEVAGWFNESPIVAVTGSNGKTTVTNWLDHTWSLAGREYAIAGNIGRAFSDIVDHSTPQKDALLEVSSFQLDHIDTFRPDISMLLNVTADHLDRYDNDFEKYAAAKFRITENQSSNDWLIYNHDDPTIAEHITTLKKKRRYPAPAGLFRQSRAIGERWRFRAGRQYNYQN